MARKSAKSTRKKADPKGMPKTDPATESDRTTAHPNARARESTPRPDPDAERREAAKLAILDHLATTGDTITEACRVLQIPRRTLYDWKKADKVFAERLRDAYEAGGDALEQEALRRAIKGWREPVFHLGKKVGGVTKKSDSLLQFLIHRRDRIEAQRAERPPADAGMVSLDISKMTPEERKVVRAALERQQREEAAAVGGPGR